MVYEISVDQRFEPLTFFYFKISTRFQSGYLQKAAYACYLHGSLYRSFRCLDKLLLSTISKLKSFSRLLTSSLTTFTTYSA